MDAGGEFSLFYTNCEKQTVVSFDIRVALYNVKANGYKDFLSVGEDMLPIVFMVRHCLSRTHCIHAATCPHSRQGSVQGLLCHR